MDGTSEEWPKPYTGFVEHRMVAGILGIECQNDGLLAAVFELEVLQWAPMAGTDAGICGIFLGKTGMGEVSNILEQCNGVQVKQGRAMAMAQVWNGWGLN